MKFLRRSCSLPMGADFLQLRCSKIRVNTIFLHAFHYQGRYKVKFVWLPRNLHRDDYLCPGVLRLKGRADFLGGSCLVTHLSSGHSRRFYPLCQVPAGPGCCSNSKKRTSGKKFQCPLCVAVSGQKNYNQGIQRQGLEKHIALPECQRRGRVLGSLRPG